MLTLNEALRLVQARARRTEGATHPAAVARGGSRMSHLDGRGGRAVPRQVLRTRVRPPTHLKWMYGITPKIVALVICLITLTLVATGVLFAELRNASDHYSTAVADESLAVQAEKVESAFQQQIHEWKNVLLRGSNPQELTTYVTAFQTRSSDTAVQAEVLVRLSTPDASVHDLFVKFARGHQDLGQLYAVALARFAATSGRDAEEADRGVRGKDRPLTALLEQAVDQLETRADREAKSTRDNITFRIRLITVLGLFVMALVVIALWLAIRNIVRPIRDLTIAAKVAAHERLPDVVEQIRATSEDVALPTLPPIEISTGDELEELANAVTTLQTTAVTLAVEQHQSEHDANAMLVNLGRRNQNLLNRTLSYITSLEESETDAAVLEQLFRLDHATTRIRRNAESMLVLAGASQTRTWAKPIPCGDVIRASLSEIEHYDRVDFYYIEPAVVSGGATADISHLLAELVENATNFSPPTARVTIVGQHVANGYRIRVIDEGVGMTSREIKSANQRIFRAAHGRADGALLGLYVVGKLAARRGIEVTLEASGGRGVTANVLLPSDLLVSGVKAVPLPQVTSGEGPWDVTVGQGQALPVLTAPTGSMAQVTFEPKNGAEHPISATAMATAVTDDALTSPTSSRGYNHDQSFSDVPARIQGAQLPGSEAALGIGAPYGSHALTPLKGYETDDRPSAYQTDASIDRDHDKFWSEDAPTNDDPSLQEPIVGARVPGARLAQLGLLEGKTDIVPETPTDSNRWRLRNFQLNVSAARNGQSPLTPDNDTRPRRDDA